MVAKISNRYNQVSNLHQDTTWESDIITIKHHKQEHRGQPCPSRRPQGSNAPLYIPRVRKVAKIRNQYNQVPHLPQDTTWESDKNIIKHHKQEHRGQLFPSRWPQGSNGSLYILRVWKLAKIRNLYNQVPHLPQHTTRESDKNSLP